MARYFTEEQYDLPQVDPLDWELWERLAKLIEPYLPAGWMQPLFFATDSRGQYDAPTLEVFRAEVDEQEQPPDTVRMTFSTSSQGMRFVNAYASRSIGSGGRVNGEDEAFVNHMGARIRDLYALAAERMSPTPPSSDATFEDVQLRAAEEYALKQAEGPQYVNVVTDVLPVPRKPGRLTRCGRYVRKHVETIAIGIVVTVVAGLILHFGFGIG